MRKKFILLLFGIALFITGVYVSTFLTTAWIIVGTLMAAIGGGLTGVNTYLVVSNDSKKY